MSHLTKCLLMALLPLTLHLHMLAQGSRTLIVKSKSSSIYRPKQVPASAENVAQLKLPPGFAVQKFAEGLGFPRFMVIGKDSSVYITDRDKGTLTRIRDTDQDGKADLVQILLHRENIHGIDLRNDSMYLATCREVMMVKLLPDGAIDSTRVDTIMKDLPDCGQHKNRTLRLGPDGMLYISAGSTCNSCAEGNSESATMLRSALDGSGRKVYAKGLRNTIGFDWHPVAKTIWGFDHGIDELGDDIQKEELNKIVEAGDYGWPYIMEKGKFDIHHDPKGGVTHDQYAAKCVNPVLLYTAHASPMDFRFYTGTQFPGKYRNGAFAAMRGSWNRSKPSGYRLLFVNFNQQGEAVSIEEFMTGFLVNQEKEQFGRPCGIAQYPDGSLLLSDDAGGVIYRITYNKQ